MAAGADVGQSLLPFAGDADYTYGGPGVRDGWGGAGPGAGEELYPLPEPKPLPVLVLAPRIHVSTAEAYGRWPGPR